MLLVALALPLASALQDVPGERFEELLLKHAGAGWSGAALVAKGEAVLHAAGYGFADFDADRPNDADTLFEIGSVTKPFTAVAVLHLAQERRLALDDSIAVLLPAVPTHSRAITLRHLLAHTSGIPRHYDDGRGEDLARAVVDYLVGGPEGRPGSKWEYWNGGYALLAGVIERASGAGYTQYLEAQLFAPAGMDSTGFTGDTDLDPARVAVGRSAKGARTALEHPYGSYGYQYRGMGGIVTSVRDLHRFDRALASGKLLDAEHEQALFTRVAGEYALGWFVRRAYDGSVRQSHGGSVRGFVADFRRLPEHDACIVVLANDDQARPWEIGDDLECLLLGRALVHPPPAGNVVTADDAGLYAGTYVGAAGRLVVRAAGGLLMAGVEGQALIEALGGAGELDWKADLGELATRAAAIVEGLARGDTSPLRTHMAKRIPASWPDTMRRSVWPAHLALHGDFRGARPTGACARDGHVEVLLALEHEGGPARARLSFGPAGLERLELDPRSAAFPASGPLQPLRKGVFRLPLGPDPAKLEFDLDARPAPSVRIGTLKLARH
ncbi:MAG TPA: serine hydrolase domain-containing protein [Planctomycetota bacterium]